MSAMTDMAAETRLLGGGLSSLPRVNLLPPEIGELAQFRKIQVGLAGVVLLAVAGVGLAYANASASVTDAETTVASATAEQGALQAQITEFARVKSIYQQAADAQTMLTQAMGQEVRYSRLLSDLSLSIPDNVWVTEAVFDQPAVAGADAAGAAPTPGLGSVTLTGVAFAHNDVASWLESLAEQKGYANPYLTSSKESLIGKRGVVDWTTTVVLTPEALSGRFTAPAGG